MAQQQSADDRRRADLEAARYLANNQRLVQAADAIRALSPAPTAAELEEYGVAEVQDQAQGLQQFLSELDAEDWVGAATAAGGTLRSYVKHAKGSPLYSAKLECDLDCGMINVLACIQEWDLYDQWMPYLKASSRVTPIRDTVFEKTLYAEFGGFPRPVAAFVCPRDAVVEGFTADLSTAGCARLAVVFRSTADPGHDVPQAGTVRAVLHIGGVDVREADEGACTARFLLSGDPMLAFVPHWAVNWLIKHTMRLVLDMMLELTSGRGSKAFRERVAARPGVYGPLADRIARVFGARWSSLRLCEGPSQVAVTEEFAMQAKTFSDPFIDACIFDSFSPSFQVIEDMPLVQPRAALPQPQQQVVARGDERAAANRVGMAVGAQGAEQATLRDVFRPPPLSPGAAAAVAVGRRVNSVVTFVRDFVTAIMAPPPQ
eukprot:m51a1_g10953 putative protein kinase domain protein (431) ;mRNA; r:201857-203928